MAFAVCVKCAQEHNPFGVCPAVTQQSVTQQPVNRVTQHNATRQRAWRFAHPAAHRAYQRVYMAKRRAHAS